MGNLTRDPEIRYTQSGNALCALGLAVNRRYTNARGEEQTETCFVDLDVWGRQAESCNNYLSKGSPVFVEGRLRFDQWDDRETGRKRSRLTVTAERVQFLSSPGRGSEFDDRPAEFRDSEPRRESKFTDRRDDRPEPKRATPPPFPGDDDSDTQPESASNPPGDDDEAIDDIPF